MLIINKWNIPNVNISRMLNLSIFTPYKGNYHYKIISSFYKKEGRISTLFRSSDMYFENR